MSKPPDDDLTALKSSANLVTLFQQKGLQLEKTGADYRCLCPFHEDKNPSLVISPKKGLWHCFGCGEGGSVLDFIMKTEKVSLRHAVEILRENKTAVLSPEIRKSRATVPAFSSPVTLSADDQKLLHEVTDYYHDRLSQNPQALEYLSSRGLDDPTLHEKFRIGFCDRTLGLRLPQRNRQDGATFRERLQALGIIKESGHEHFRGSITIPIFDPSGQIREIYGRKITPNLRTGTPKHTYLPGPHGGLFNPECLSHPSKTIFLCEAIIDALTLFRFGIPNTTAAFGVNGFTLEMFSLFIAHQIGKVYLCFDADPPGDDASQKLAQNLHSEGIECHRLTLPEGEDINSFLVSAAHPEGELKRLINAAQWMDFAAQNSVKTSPHKSPNPAPTAHDSADSPANPHPAHAPGLYNNLSLAAVDGAASGHPVHPATVACPSPSTANTSPRNRQRAAERNGQGLAQDPKPSPAAATEAEASAQSEHDQQPPATGHDQKDQKSPNQPQEPSLSAAVLLLDPEATPAILTTPTRIQGEDIFINFGEREYRIRGLAKNLSFEVLRVNMRATHREKFHIDTFDLFHARNRVAFINTAAKELVLDPETVKTDLGRVLFKLEELQEAAIKATLQQTKPEDPAMKDSDREAALELLRSPELVERIISDFTVCGIIGERTNLLTGYLAATSRLLERPLGVVLQSSSAAGKTSLMDAILNFIPTEQKVKYSAMTGQSLFYMGETDLKQKILAIVEEEGAEKASYALKLLQSEGELTIASTGKESKTGRMITHEYRVQGPVMVFLTSTAIDIDEELLNRCLVLTVNESREQTKAIHDFQRYSQTLEGLLCREKKRNTCKLHQNAQRLLRPLLVANPYAVDLTFLDDKTRTRRDHLKYQHLIRSIALLHQYQREIKTATVDGIKRDYIEVTLADICMANELAHEVLGRSLDELPPQTRRLLDLIHQMVTIKCQEANTSRDSFHFSRRMVRDYTGWGNTQLKLHLSRLEDLEYLIIYKSQGARKIGYELLYSGEEPETGRFLPGLIDVESLTRGRKTVKAINPHDYDTTWSGSNEEWSGQSRPKVAPKPGHCRGDSTPDPERLEAGFCEEDQKTHKTPPEKNLSSYSFLDHTYTDPELSLKACLITLLTSGTGGFKRYAGIA